MGLNMIYDHPILSMRNPVDADTARGRRYVNISPNDMRYHKRKAHRKTRRLVKDALKGNKIRCNKRPGNSWSLY